VSAVAIGPCSRRWEVDWCRTEEVTELRGYIDTYWRKGHVLAADEHLLRWQYRDPKADNRLSVLVARAPEGILGFLGVIPFDLCVRGERLPAVWLATWHALPAARDEQVGLVLLRQVLQGPWAMVGCMGFNDTTQRILGALRFDVRNPVSRWVRAGSAAALGRLLAADPEQRFGGMAPHLISKAVDPVDTWTVEVTPWSTEIEAAWDDVWTRRFASGIVGTWRDSAYLRWRYLDHPRFRYTVRVARARGGGEPLGFAVFRTERVRERDELVVRLVELLAVEAEAGRALASDVVRAADGTGAAFSDFYCTSPTFARALEEVGFVAEEELDLPLPGLFQPLDFGRAGLRGAFWIQSSIARSSTEFFQVPELYFTRADGDQDRPN
jgi:hypothetical protein